MSAMYQGTFAAFRFYDDNAGSATSTPLEAQDTNHSFNVSSDNSLQLRTRVDETGGVAGSTMDDFSLLYSKNSGAFVAVPTTDSGDGIRAAAAGLTNQAATDNRVTDGISDPGGSFVAGVESDDGVANDVALPSSGFTEFAYGIEFIAANVADGDTFDFELGTKVGVNSVVPRVTVTKAAGAKTASGNPLIAEVTAAGTVTQTYKPSGTPVTEEITASGIAQLQPKASGTPSIEVITASGTATIIKRATSAVIIAAVTASGVASLTTTLPASGNPLIEEITASGVARFAHDATGTGGTFSHIGTGTSGGNSSTASRTHGLTILAGDLVFAYVHANGATQGITDDGGGTTFNNPLNTDPDASGETAWHAVYWKIAGGSEPAAYTWTLDNSNEWRIVLKVFRPSGGTPVVDLAVVEHLGTSSTTTMVCEAPNGRSISAGALSIVTGGKDGRTGPDLTSANESYVDVAGNHTNQATGIAHRIFSSAATLNTVNLTPTGGNDFTYSTHISFVIPGGPTIEEITASGVATLSGEVTASGNPLIAEVTAAGTVTQTYKPSGTPVTEETTAAGTVTQTYKPSGTPSIDAITASGVVTLFKIATGTPTIDAITASGVARFALAASGTPSIDAITASGVAEVGPKVITGNPLIDEVTATGTVTQVQKPTGTPSIDVITASGVASIAGVLTATGTPLIPEITASGVAEVGPKVITGNPLIDEVTAAGTATQTYKPSGTPSIDVITASGVATLGARTASGTPSIDVVTASGVAEVGAKIITGTPSIDEVTASGTATQTYKPTGTPSIDAVTAAGSITQTYKSSGTPTIEVITASGVAGTLDPIASGVPSIDEITASGVADIGPKVITGTPSIDVITAAGTVTQTYKPTGTPSIEVITAYGVVVNNPILQDLIDRQSVKPFENKTSVLRAENRTSVVERNNQTSIKLFENNKTIIPG